VLIEEAQSRGAEFVDMRPIYKQQADENLWVEDGIHPTAEAYEAWAAELSNAVPAPCTWAICVRFVALCAPQRTQIATEMRRRTGATRRERP
jgi:hypothetical protein